MEKKIAVSSAAFRARAALLLHGVPFRAVRVRVRAAYANNYFQLSYVSRGRINLSTVIAPLCLALLRGRRPSGRPRYCVPYGFEKSVRIEFPDGHVLYIIIFADNNRRDVESTTRVITILIVCFT